MQANIDLSIWQMTAAYIFILVLIVIVRFKGIPREKEILISSLRMTIQLVLVGYILAFVFEHSHPVYTLGIITIMLIFAINNIFNRTILQLSSEIKKIIALSMTLGILASITYFVLIVLQVYPWYEPRYIIPIAGMIIGNSMTGISLGVKTLVEGMTTHKQLVEAALILGATPKRASEQIVKSAFDAAMMPTINSMVGMGIVFLPGMMTGQILGGASPVIAIEYQIAVMLGIVGSVSLTVLLFVQLGYKTFFNSRSQIKL
ncbi:iron export ABC transporter permease subunit FetB [Desulfosporosinus sp.]|uniref:ABC transporter permease n=1 Tax=Desulfosporosinus sp. TaxID=157907 RepID=UPI0025C73DEC|nr:iron export ABC transporter permease subunit FetB [Desulfosporosinus sp.]MBC2721428.1 iron export ABC transporter permease subunit FetB [Desulfosporosinus sp.]MBC2727484.1 iron export ABC transporter permease subunit FetB [Desulfosporosinus sp.]